MRAQKERIYRIGQLSALSGLSRDTLRYYERAGLLTTPRRTTGGFRLYEPGDLERLKLIQRAQVVGLSIKEIRELLKLERSGGRCPKVRELLGQRMEQVDARVAELRAFRRSLVAAQRRCDEALKEDSECACPVVERGAVGGARARANGLARKRVM